MQLVPFNSASRAKARLLALVRAGYLEREFVGTISGGRKAIYSLPRARRVRRTSKRLASAQTERFIEHQLRLNELFLVLRKASEPRLIRWERISAPLFGSRGIVPDAYAEFAAQDVRRGAYIEMDLATEALPVWGKKVQEYLKYARSGMFQERHGLSSFRVLVVADTEDRIQAIRSMIAKQTDKVFWVATTKKIKSEGFWAPIWQRPNGSEEHSLF